MKKLIAVLILFFSSFSFAMSDTDVFVARDPSGFKIVLVSDSCPVPGLEGSRISFARYENQLAVGCWFVKDSEVNILWLPKEHDPIIMKYDIKIFSLEKLV